MATSPQKTTLVSLPSEILLRIFECCPNLTVAKNFASTCHATYSTWLGFQKSICEEILPRRIRCYDDAKAVAAAQDKALLPGSLTYEEHVRCLLWNARCAECACDEMQSYVRKKFVFFHDSERERTIHLFYTMQTFAILYNSPVTVQPWSSSAAERYLHAISDYDCYLISNLAFYWSSIVYQMERLGRLSPPEIAEMSRELQQNSVEEAPRQSLTHNLEKARLVHPALTAWDEAMKVMFEYIPDKYLSGATSTGKLPGSGLGIRLLLDDHQYRLVKPN